MAPDNAVPSDLVIHSYSMSEVLAGSSVSLGAGILIVDERPDIFEVDRGQNCADYKLVGPVLAMAIADGTVDLLQPSQKLAGFRATHLGHRHGA